MDPWGGSYMMEALTAELERSAGALIDEVEALGGMAAAIESGMPKSRIEAAAARKQARIDAGADVVVGVNKYELRKGAAGDGGVEVRSIDNAAVREAQIARLRAVRAKRDNAAVASALAALRASAAVTEPTGAASDPRNLLRLSITAARARATLGEISDALRDVWGEHRPRDAVVQGAYAGAYATAAAGGDGSDKAAVVSAEKEYADTLAAVSAFATEAGRRPRILVAKMGQDGHDRGAKVIASGFADMGFDVDVGPLFSTPDEVARAAVDADVHVVGVSSQAAGHRTLVPMLVAALAARGGASICVVVGGVIPPADYAALRAAGVAAIFGPGTRIPIAAREVLAAIRGARSSSGGGPA